MNLPSVAGTLFLGHDSESSPWARVGDGQGHTKGHNVFQGVLVAR